MDVLRIVDGRSKVNVNGVRPFAWPFPEKLASLETENTSPESIEISRDDRYLGTLENLHHTRFEGLNLATTANSTLRKNTDQLPIIKGVIGCLQGLDD